MDNTKESIEVEEHRKWINPLLFIIIASSLYFTLFWFLVWPITVEELRSYYYSTTSHPDLYWPWYWVTLFWLLALLLWSIPLCVVVYCCAARYRRKVCKYERKVTSNVEVPAPPYPTQLCLIQPASPDESKKPLPTSFPAVAVQNGQSPYRMSDVSHMEPKLSTSSSSTSSLSKKRDHTDVSTRALYGGSTQEQISILQREPSPGATTNQKSSSAHNLATTRNLHVTSSTREPQRNKSDSSSCNESQKYDEDMIICSPPSSPKLKSKSPSLSGDLTALMTQQFADKCKKSSSISSSASEVSHNVDSVSSKDSSGKIMQDSLDEIQQVEDLKPESEKPSVENDDDDDVFTADMADEPRNSKLSNFDEYLHLVPMSPGEVTQTLVVIEQETKPRLKRQLSSQSEYFIASAYQKPSVTSEVFLAIAGDVEANTIVKPSAAQEEVVFVGSIDTSFKQVQ